MEIELVSAYRAMQPYSAIISTARKIGDGFLTPQVQEFFLNACLDDKICRQFPPKLSYTNSVLKNFILAAEKDSVDVLDALYDKLSGFCSSASLENNRAFKTFTYSSRLGGDLDETITVQVSSNILEGGTGCYCWPAGLYLAEVLLSSSPSVVKSKCCLELGSGAGLLGICLSRLEASKVILTDGDQVALENLRQNLEFNNIRADNAQVEVRKLSWETFVGEDDWNEQVKPELILGADVIYDPQCVPSLVKALSFFLRRRIQPSCVALLATVKRNPTTLSLFVESAVQSGLDVSDATASLLPSKCWKGIEVEDSSNIVLHKLTARK